MNRKTIIALGVGIVLTWALLTLYGVPLIARWVPDLKCSASVADAFGAVNALFSGLALAGIIVTLYMQREELKLQREELQLTRDELAKSAEAQKESSESQRVVVELSTRRAVMEFYQFCLTNRKEYSSVGARYQESLQGMDEQANEILKLLEKLSINKSGD